MADFNITIEELATHDALRPANITITPTKERQDVYPPGTYNCFDSVTVEAIPAEYESPTATAVLTQSQRPCYDMEVTDGGSTTTDHPLVFGCIDVSEISSIDVDVDPAMSTMWNGDGVEDETITHIRRHPAGAPYANYPNAVTVGDRAFYGSYTSGSIYLEHVETVGEEAFSHMSSWGQTLYITLPSVRKIGDRAFAYSDLVRLNLRDNQHIPALGANAFRGCTNLSEIRVPSQLLDDYLADPIWSQYAQYFTT